MNQKTSQTNDGNQDWERLIAATQALLLLAGTIFAAASFVTYFTAEATASFGTMLFQTLGYAFAAFGGSYLAAQFTAYPINAFGNALRPYNKVYSDPDNEKFLNLYHRYQQLKPELSEHNIHIFEYYFSVYRNWLYEVQNPEWKGMILRNISSFLEYIFIILEKPTPTKDLQISKAEIDAKARQLLELLETYPEQREAIIKFAKTVGFYQLKANEYKPIRALCLQGPPGVGKTTLIQRICDIYGINLIILKGKSTISEGAYERQFWDELEPSKANPLVQAIYNSNKLGFEGYTVLFFDEIDKLPNSKDSHPTPNMPTIQEVAQFLLALTDNDQATIIDPYTGFEFPKNRIIVIIAINDGIFNLIPGLESRMDLIKFGKISKELKLQIALQKLTLLCIANNVPLSEDLIATVKDMVNHNDEDGVRELGDDIKALVYQASQTNFYTNTVLAEDPQQILLYYKNLIRTKPPEKPVPVDVPTPSNNATPSAAPAA